VIIPIHGRCSSAKKAQQPVGNATIFICSRLAMSFKRFACHPVNVHSCLDFGVWCMVFGIWPLADF